MGLDEPKWFAQRTEPIWNKHLLPYADQVDSYLELGVCCGHSMRWVLENLKPSRADGVDPYAAPRSKDQPAFDRYKQNAMANLKPWFEDEQVRLFNVTSDEYFMAWHEGMHGSQFFPFKGRTGRKRLSSSWPPPRFDLIYIDGDHSAYQSMLDMMLAYELLAVDTWELELSTVDRRGRQGTKNKAGGMMIVDDIHRIMGKNGRPQVGTAIPAFESVMYGRMNRLWQDGRQVCYTRIG